MGLYNAKGERIYAAYSSNGEATATVYDKYGRVRFPYDLCVMSFNPQWFTGINAQNEMLMDIFFKNNADLVGLQEVSKTSTIPEAGQKVMNMLYPYSAMSNHYNYLALKSKYELSDITMADYASQDPNMDETRGYLKAYVTVNGARICFITTHLELNATYRNAQMAELFAIAQNESYVILTGDFNTVSDELDSDDYRNMYKQYVDAGYHLANCSERNGFIKTYSGGNDHTSLDQFRSACDNIIVSGNIDIVSREVDTTKLHFLNGDNIDHCPIIAELIVNSEEVIPELESISAVFTQGGHTVYTNDSLESLKPYLIVTGHYDDGSSSVISSYELNGTLSEGISTITVLYEGLVTTFNVVVSANVPTGYTRLTYVEANGQQYVNIRVNESQVKSAVYKFLVTDESKTADGAHILSSANMFFPCPKIYNGAKQLFYARGGASGGLTYNWYENEQYLIDAWKMEADSCYANNVLVSSAMRQGSSSSPSNAFTVFTYGGNISATKYRFYGRLYEMKIYDSSGVLIKNLIPAKNNSNVAGLYDMVSSTFYTSGSGTALIAGDVA